MRVAVASENPVKLESVRLGLSKLGDIEIVSRPVSSGVPDQPIGSEETRMGAINRARAAYDEHVDLSVGIEGGVERDVSGFVTCAWIVIFDGERIVGSARSAALPIPKAAEAMVEDGIELGHAMDALFDRENVKQAEGAAGLLTKGLITRTDLYVPAVAFAAIPLLNPEHEF